MIFVLVFHSLKILIRIQRGTRREYGSKCLRKYKWSRKSAGVFKGGLDKLIIKTKSKMKTSVANTTTSLVSRLTEALLMVYGMVCSL